MNNPSRVEKYFDDVAPSYSDASARFPWSLLRHNEARVFMGTLPNLNDQDVLELGCGAGYYTLRMLQAGAKHIHAVDFSKEMIQQIRHPGVTPIHADASSIDLGRKFPVIVSAGLLEFVPDAHALFINARRHAQQGTVMCVLAPERSTTSRLYRFNHRRHGINIHLFTADELRTIASQTGWQVTGMHHAFPFSHVMTMAAA